MKMRDTWRIIVEGKPVTDIGFRVFLLAVGEYFKFTELYARNVDINKVEILVKADRDKVDDFIKYIKLNKPEKVNISDIKITEYHGTVMSVESYYRVLSLEQFSKFISIGLNMLDNQEKMVGNQEKMLDNQEKMVGGISEISAEVKGLREDFKIYFLEKLTKIEEDIRVIKKKLGI